MMGFWQWVVVVLWIYGLINELVNHGQERRERYNFERRLMGTLAVFIILYFGGFFK